MKYVIKKGKATRIRRNMTYASFKLNKRPGVCDYRVNYPWNYKKYQDEEIEHHQIKILFLSVINLLIA